MDGTLVDSEKYHIEAWQKMFDEFGIAMSHEDLMAYVGVSDVNICIDLANRFDIGKSSIDILDTKRHYYRNHSQKNVQLIAGVSEGLASLKGQLPMAIATMSSDYEAEKSLEYTGIRKYFTHVVTADHVKHHKPDPACYEMACANLGVETLRCIGVEDSVSGVSASKAAGLYTIGVANTVASGLLGHADVVVENSTEAFVLIRKILEKKHELI